MARDGGWLARMAAGVLPMIGLLVEVSPATAQQDYPSRPIHLLVGFPAGSGADIGVRFVAEQLQQVSKQRVLVENKPGAGSNIAIGVAARAKPDGYTVLMAASSAMAGSRFLYKDFSIDTEREFEPAATVWRATFVLTVAPGSAIDSVATLTAHLKSRSRSLHAFTNQTGQLAASYYLTSVGASSNGVPYKAAAEAVADLGSGTIDFMMLDGAFASGQLRAGRIKPLAVTSAKRSTAIPLIPTMQEAGLAGFEFAPFWAAYLPKGTAPEIMRRLTGWFIDVVKLDATRERFNTTGSIAVGEGPEETRAALKSEIAKWAATVKAAGIEPQ